MKTANNERCVPGYEPLCETSPDDCYVCMFSNNTEMDAHAFCTPPNPKTLHGGCLGYMENALCHLTVEIGGRVLAQKSALAHGNTAMLHV